jgi:hypothetical protein
MGRGSSERSADGAQLNVWLTGDDGTVPLWKKFLTERALVEPGDKLKSNSPTRRYSLEQVGAGWSLQITGHTN